MDEVIKDRYGKTIGFIRVQGTITRICDNLNRTLGTYNSATDYTADKNGRTVAKGNQLMRLLTS